MWNNLGAAPEPLVREITVIGPGHGESVVVHLGNGEWIVVDSCAIPSMPNSSAPLQYLQALGVDVANAVKLVIVSHWDDDHIRGISLALEAFRSSAFCCATAFTEREFVRFVRSLSLGGQTTGQGNVSEFRRCLEILGARGQAVRTATPGRQLSDKGMPVVKSWSPSDYDNMCFLRYVAENYPSDWGPMRRAVPGSPNLTSVVVSIDWDDQSALLGGDMLRSMDARRGWGAIVSEAKRVGFSKGGVIKVPHHGSEGAHDAEMWTDLLCAQPISVTAPFGKGAAKSRPPQPNDVRRIAGLSSEAYLTAGRSAGSIAKKEPAVTRSLREGGIRITSARTAIGMVRLRGLSGKGWSAELFGDARRAK